MEKGCGESIQRKDYLREQRGKFKMRKVDFTLKKVKTDCNFNDENLL